MFVRSLIFFVTLFNCAVQALHAQQPGLTLSSNDQYTIQNKTDIPLIGLIMISSLSNLYWRSDDYFHFRQVSALDAADLPVIDRKTVEIDPERSIVADHWSDIVAYGSVALPFAVVASTNPDYYEMITLAFMYAEGLALSVSLTGNIKAAVNRPRPYTYSDAYTKRVRTDDEAWMSFPSGHTSNTAFNCFFAASLTDRMFLREKPLYLRFANWMVAGSIPVVAGYLRVEAGKHFPTDVMAGYALGAGLGLLIPYMHLKKDSALTIAPFRYDQGGGLSIGVQF